MSEQNDGNGHAVADAPAGNAAKQAAAEVAREAVAKAMKEGQERARPSIDHRTAVALVQAEKNQRAQACLKELQDVAARHRCRVDAQPRFDPDGRGGFVVGAGVVVVPQD